MQAHRTGSASARCKGSSLHVATPLRFASLHFTSRWPWCSQQLSLELEGERSSETRRDQTRRDSARAPVADTAHAKLLLAADGRGDHCRELDPCPCARIILQPHMPHLHAHHHLHHAIAAPYSTMSARIPARRLGQSGTYPCAQVSTTTAAQWLSLPTTKQ